MFDLFVLDYLSLSVCLSVSLSLPLSLSLVSLSISFSTSLSPYFLSKLLFFHSFSLPFSPSLSTSVSFCITLSSFLFFSLPPLLSHFSNFRCWFRNYTLFELLSVRVSLLCAAYNHKLRLTRLHLVDDASAIFTVVKTMGPVRLL